MLRPRIVILGAGFGGMYVAKRFKRLAKKGLIELTIINRTNYFLFTPLLHEVATGGLNPRNVAEPIREVFAGTPVRVVQAAVESIDTEKRIVTVSAHNETTEIPYDYLVIATGAETNYYGIPGASEHTLPLKNLADAARIRSEIIDAFEHAVLAQSEEERRELLSFAIVGGGATGVELAAELSDFVQGMIKRYYRKTHCAPSEPGHCRSEEAAITLIHTGKELLEMFVPSLRKASERRLIKSGVVLRLGSTVTEVMPDGLRLADGTFVIASTTVWTAGVKAIVPRFAGEQPALSGSRLIVDEFFRLQGHERIFALGDAAGYVDTHAFKKDSKNTRPVPMLAQAAVLETKIVTANILASIRRKPLFTFQYKPKGAMVSVGQWFAIGEIYSLHIAGWFTWWLWRTVYLFKFASWQKRIRIMIEWTLDIFFPRDITKLM